MTVDQGHILHDRYTRGEELTTKEQQALGAWYDEQDKVERMLLTQKKAPADSAALRIQLEAAIKQLALVSRQIDEVMLANDALRRDIIHLQTQLVPQLVG